MVRKNTPFSFHGVKLGEFDSEVCTKCDEAWFTEEASDKIDAKAKELGLRGKGNHSYV